VTRDYKEKRSRTNSKDCFDDKDREMHTNRKVRRAVLIRLEQRDQKDMLDPEESIEE